MDVRTEPARLAELASFGVLDTPPEPAFDDIVQAAADLVGCPTSFIGLLDADRNVFKARCGLDGEQVPRELTFCTHVVSGGVPLIVPDARADPRFADNPFVTAADGVRFYAGYPLRTASGAVLGTLCVLDREPRPAGLTPMQDRMLTVLAAQVIAQLELRKTLAERDGDVRALRVALAEQAAAQQALVLSENRFRTLFESNPVGQVELSPTGVVQRVNAAFAALAGAEPPWALPGQRLPETAVPADALARATASPGTAVHSERLIQRPDGTTRELAQTLVGVPGPDGQTAVLIASVVDVTERTAAQRRLAELAAELAQARDEALRRNALTETVLATVGVGIVACDADGHLSLFNQATREFHGMTADPDADPADLAARYALFESDGTTPLETDQVPLLRALREGSVEGDVIVIAPDGLPARVVRCDGRAMQAGDGRRLGAVVVMTDITHQTQVARELAERAEFINILLDTAHTAIWSCDTTGRPTYVNAVAREALGSPDLATLTWDAAAARALADRFVLLDRAGQPLAREQWPLQRALAGQETGEVEVVLAAAGRPRRTLLLQASPLHDATGAISGAMLTGHDVTELRESEARFRAAFHDGPTPAAHLDSSGAVREVNPALRRLTGLRTAALLGRALSEHVHPDDQPRLTRVLAGPGTGAEPVELRLLRVDGSAVWCELATTVSRGPDGQPTVLAQFLDVDARKVQELALEQAARRDPLTSLANRSQLPGLVQAALDAGPLHTAGLLFLDLDRFKSVNDTHGHDAGDALLVEVAARLTRAVRPQDTVLRLGGDEFVVVCTLPTAHGAELLSGLADRLAAAVQAPVAFRGTTLTVGVSIGAALARPGQTAPSLLEQADRSMYRRKQAGAAAR